MVCAPRSHDIKLIFLGMSVELIPLKSRIQTGRFEPLEQIERMVKRARTTLFENDILAISGKYLAMAEGRVVRLGKVAPLEDAVKLATRYSMSPAMTEIVLRESDLVLKGLNGFLLTVKDGAFAPNAGVDRSNVGHGKVILHPTFPSRQARVIRDWAFVRYGVQVGVVITDSRLQPIRKGTVGIAIGACGVPSTVDERGKKDLFGNLMKVTRRAIVDDVASAAQLVMGETSEAVPAVIIRGHGIPVDQKYDGLDISIPLSECIYVRGLSGYLREAS
jgi:coenzyme F420-0:L-glutamate ligase/coenzyme F420-1:gamma-L-glutamate ligase